MSDKLLLQATSLVSNKSTRAELSDQQECAHIDIAEVYIAPVQQESIVGSLPELSTVCEASSTEDEESELSLRSLVDAAHLA